MAAKLGERPWTAAVDEPGLAGSALVVARDVLARLRDPTAVGPPRVPPGIAQGHCGLAIACGYADSCFPGEGWDRSAHEHLIWAVRGAENPGVRTFGLFSGLAGIAFTAAYLSRQGMRYRTLRARLDDSLRSGIPGLIGDDSGAEPDGDSDGPAATRPGLPVGRFDVVSGWTGIAAHLLGEPGGHERDPALATVLDRLVDMVRPGEDPPAWWTPGALIVDRAMRTRYPGGVLNCGMAHGIAGPLAVLALAYEENVPVDGLRAAVRDTAGWLARQATEDAWGPAFPAVVPWGASVTMPGRARDAWCYGGPGVARALWLAGTALADDALRELACRTVVAALRRPASLRRIDAPGFCHGVAGLLQITLRFAAETSAEIFRVGAADLVRQLVDAYEPGSPFGFRGGEPGGDRADRPGLLEGSSAVALVLLSAVTPEAPAWDRLFLLS